MTEEMVKKATENAKKHGYKNVEFRHGEIENLPVDDNSVNVIISNCVINLSTDKLKTFREAFRVLKPGGRIIVSDLVTEGAVPEQVKEDFELWTGCIAGALQRKDYLNKIKEAGFQNTEILDESTWKSGKINVDITSIKVKAVKL
jgi:arsenite methyltransferase